jgi:hypothetical protein
MCEKQLDMIQQYYKPGRMIAVSNDDEDMTDLADAAVQEQVRVLEGDLLRPFEADGAAQP